MDILFCVKSVSTNFKLHKRKNTDEDEQYVFYNTHEPIIIAGTLGQRSEAKETSEQRQRPRGTHSNRLSGYLYCADCGRRMTLQTHYSKKDRSVQYSYRCGGYASKVNSCYCPFN